MLAGGLGSSMVVMVVLPVEGVEVTVAEPPQGAVPCFVAMGVPVARSGVVLDQTV